MYCGGKVVHWFTNGMLYIERSAAQKQNCILIWRYKIDYYMSLGTTKVNGWLQGGTSNYDGTGEIHKQNETE